MRAYREIVPAAPVLRWSIPIGAAFFAALALERWYHQHLSLTLLGIVAVTTLFLLWFSLQFARLFIQIDAEAVRLAFGSFDKQIPRSAVQSAAVTPLVWWRIRGLGIRRGWRREYWLARFGRGLRLELRDGRTLFFSTSSPEKVLSFLFPT